MILILNGPNEFEKHFENNELSKHLSQLQSYRIETVTLESRDNTAATRSKLSTILSTLSGPVLELYCGIINFPLSSKEQNYKLLYDLLKKYSTYCNECKQLIISLPHTLTDEEKLNLSELCSSKKHRFVDMEYISDLQSITKFIDKLFNEFNLSFDSETLRQQTTDSIIKSSSFSLSKNGSIDYCQTTARRKIVYDQFKIFNTIKGFDIYKLANNDRILREHEVHSLLYTLDLKPSNYMSLSKIVNCNNIKELLDIWDNIFECYNTQDIFEFINFLKDAIMEHYIQKRNTKKSKIIKSSKFKLKSYQDFFNGLSELCTKNNLSFNSYKNSLLLLFILQQK